MKKLFVIAAFIAIGNAASAQSDCPCCTENHKKFDFWVGDWIVYDTAGNIVGENTIEKLENGCIISEYWRGAQGGTGRSYNYYDRSDSTWNQVWIAGNGSNLVLKGTGDNNVMVLKSDLQKSRDGKLYHNRITWTQNKDGSVTQHWQLLDKDGNVLPVSAFKGIYRRK